MKVKINTRKIVAVVLWCIAGAGLLVLLGAAVRKKKDAVCMGYEIDINGSAEGQWFIDKNDVTDMLADNPAGIRGANLNSFDLKKMEKRLKKNVWIKDVQLFFDNNDILQVEIIEREPVARIFTARGSSFYIDTSCFVLPLSEKVSARVPVFTGFPSANPGKRDSLLLREVITLSNYIMRDPFWMAQVSQIDINRENTFELIPTIGDHIIEFGSAENVKNKFDRLFLFYRNVLAKKGIDFYSTIKVQYADQIVGVKNERFLNRTDSIEAEKKIKMLVEAEKKPADSIVKIEPVKAKDKSKIASPVRQRPAETGSKQDEAVKQKVPKAVMKTKSDR